MANTKERKKRKYRLFNGKETDNRAVALKDRETFARDFGALWEKGDLETRKKMIRYAGEFPPEEGIGMALAGMDDYTRDVKLETKRVILFLADKISIKKGRVVSQDTAIRSELFSRRIFQEMTRTLALDELSFYIRILLEINGRGPFFVWKFFTRDILPPNIFTDTLNKLPQSLRLRFVQYFFRSEISERRKRAGIIRSILNGIDDPAAGAAFIVDLIDSADGCRHSVFALGGTILTEFMSRLGIPGNGTALPGEKGVIAGLKIAGIADKPDSLYRYLTLLDEAEPRRIRLSCINILGKSNASRDRRITESLIRLFEDDDPYIVIQAFKALIELDYQGLADIAVQLILAKSALRAKLYRAMCGMKAEALILVIERLEEPFATDARRTVGKQFIRRKPERLELLLGYHKKSQDSSVRAAATMMSEKIAGIMSSGLRTFRDRFIPAKLQDSAHIRKAIQAQSEEKQKKKLTDLGGRPAESEIRLVNEIFYETDIRGLRIENVSFAGSGFFKTDLSSVHFKNISMRDVRFENASLQTAVFENVNFEACVFIDTDASGATFKDCSFSGASICRSSFEYADMTGVSFAGTVIIDSDFSKTELSYASFTGARLFMTSFQYATIFQTEYIYTRAVRCNFSEADITTAANFEQSDMNLPLRGWRRIEIPDFFYKSALLETRWLNILILTHEMDCQRDVFSKYNVRRREFALDAFRPEQEELFEMIPLLLHLSQDLVPIEKNEANDPLTNNSSLKNIASGLYGYSPAQKTVKLAQRHLKCDKLRLLPGKKSHIEALFTIGSLGTIAQSSDSDIDYWVCINKETMEPDAVRFLRLKLTAIEKWAKSKFSTDVHFFIVDAESIRKGQFGGSDLEGSGSAQGMLLKEEFYRTMILVHGKIPFWCVLPAWAADQYYDLLLAIARRFHGDYLDFGNVSVIPDGEYFGASMWQLFKGLTSPFKSVMKMGLLEKYLQETEESGLLCNRMKRRWAGGKCDLIHQDSYLMLFLDIMEYYDRIGQAAVQSLVQICFFFKLGVRSMKDLDRSVFQIRKVLIQQSVERFGWKSSMLFELGCFDEWSFEKTRRFVESIDRFMLETYRKLSAGMGGAEGGKAIITERDLTLLGRKMYVHFVDQPHKVTQLPALSVSGSLFSQLYLYYRQRRGEPASWAVYSKYNKQGYADGSERPILENIIHIEEVAAWAIRNRMIQGGTTFTILPNPTPVTAPEFNALIHEMDIFFPEEIEEGLQTADLLEPYKINALYMIINYNDYRKSDRIHSLVAVFTTSWGEFFCVPFLSKNGLKTIADAETYLSRQLDRPLDNTRIGYYIHKRSRQAILKY